MIVSRVRFSAGATETFNGMTCVECSQSLASGAKNAGGDLEFDSADRLEKEAAKKRPSTGKFRKQKCPG